MAIGSPSSQCDDWKWGKVKHRRPDDSAALWHISASYVCITALSSVIAGWPRSGEWVGKWGAQTAADGLWQHISASLNTLIMFTSEIVTWAHLTLWEFGNEQQGKNSLHNVYYNELFSLKTQPSINVFCTGAPLGKNDKCINCCEKDLQLETDTDEGHGRWDLRDEA